MYDMQSQQQLTCPRVFDVQDQVKQNSTDEHDLCPSNLRISILALSRCLHDDSNISEVHLIDKSLERVMNWDALSDNEALVVAQVQNGLHSHSPLHCRVHSVMKILAN